MNWYSAIVKRILKGIILFLLPITLILFLVEKAFMLIHGLVQPMRSFLPEGSILGIGMLTFLSFVVILLICYFAGMRAEQKNLKSFLPFFEDNLLVFIPGYTLVKSSANEAIGTTDGGWKSVLISENDDWKFGIEVEQHPDGYSTVFLPEPPDAKSGEIRLVPSSRLKKLNIPASKLIAITRKYGHGASLLNIEFKNNCI